MNGSESKQAEAREADATQKTRGSEAGNGRRPPRHSGRRRDWLFPAVITLLIALLVLHPYAFAPSNDVTRLESDPGLLFGGRGLAYTEQTLEEIAGGPIEELTVEVWLRLPEDAVNYGARMIFSLHDPRYELPLCLGQWARRPFLFVPNEEWPTEWYSQLIVDERLNKEEDSFVAVVVTPQRRSLILGNALLRDEAFSAALHAPMELSRRLVLGASPGGRYRWNGELQGLALYDRALSPGEIDRHRVMAWRSGVASLAEQNHLLALFPFDDETGQPSETDRGVTESTSESRTDPSKHRTDHFANSAAGTPARIRIPGRFGARPETLLNRPSLERLRAPVYARDLMRNVLLFVPFGWLVLITAGRRSLLSWQALVAGVVLTGCLFSLSLETLQLLLPSRATTLSDILANSVGTAIGALAAVAAGKLRTPHAVAR